VVYALIHQVSTWLGWTGLPMVTTVPSVAGGVVRGTACTSCQGQAPVNMTSGTIVRTGTQEFLVALDSFAPPIQKQEASSARCGTEHATGSRGRVLPTRVQMLRSSSLTDFTLTEGTNRVRRSNHPGGQCAI